MTSGNNGVLTIASGGVVVGRDSWCDYVADGAVLIVPRWWSTVWWVCRCRNDDA